MRALFFTRIFLYYTAAILPVFHPALAVAYDNLTRMVWLVIVPAQMLLAYGFPPRRVPSLIHFPLAVGISSLLVLVSGESSPASLLVGGGAGAVSWILTRAIFFGGGRYHSLASMELFLPALIYYRLLSFTRSSEELAHQGSQMTTVIFVVSVAAFLLHGAVLYLSSFPDRAREKSRKELGALLLLGVPLVILFALLLPKDFVKHVAVYNEWNEEAPQTPQDLGQGEGDMPSGGNPEHNRNGLPLGAGEEKFPSSRNRDSGQGGGESSGQGGGAGSASGSANRLQGIPSDQWDNLSSSGEGKGKQKAVMIIASRTDPVYAAEDYLGDFDSTRGFLSSKDEPLNRLAKTRLIETWSDSKKITDRARERFPVYYLSTIDTRVLAFRPLLVEPTVQDTTYHPFDLSYHAVSAMSVSGPDEWKEIRGLNSWEKQEMSHYLELNLKEPFRSKLKAKVDGILQGKTDYFDRIDAILKFFSGYKYEMGFNDSTSISRLDHFLFKDKTGDCTEFSHSAALIARMAGIPSRVVTGYIASRDLQTPAHRHGMRILRSKIPLLKDFSPDELYLVTTSHHHSWAQFYMPGYGWVDFETTAHAIPPEPKMDPNNMDVLIPMIDEEAAKKSREYHFPWRLVGKVFGGLFAVLLVFLYVFRYSREAYHRIRLRGESPEALRSMLKSFYMKLAVEGFELKKGHQTPMEYAMHLDRFVDFARIYTMLTYREIYSVGEKEEAWKHLRQKYREVLKESRKKGLRAIFRRIFSLRGLYYR